MHITKPGKSVPPLTEVRKASHSRGHTAIEFVCRYDPKLGTAVVVGFYQMRKDVCLIDADPLFKQFDDKALGELIIEILAPSFAKEMPYVELGKGLRQAMTDARACKSGTVIMWVDERLDGDKSVVHHHNTEVK